MSFPLRQSSGTFWTVLPIPAIPSQLKVNINWCAFSTVASKLVKSNISLKFRLRLKFRTFGYFVRFFFQIKQIFYDSGDVCVYVRMYVMCKLCLCVCMGNPIVSLSLISLTRDKTRTHFGCVFWRTHTSWKMHSNIDSPKNVNYPKNTNRNFDL